MTEADAQIKVFGFKPNGETKEQDTGKILWKYNKHP